eukprot:5213443-Amphidinium_carterae.1
MHNTTQKYYQSVTRCQNYGPIKVLKIGPQHPSCDLCCYNFSFPSSVFFQCLLTSNATARRETCTFLLCPPRFCFVCRELRTKSLSYGEMLRNSSSAGCSRVHDPMSGTNRNEVTSQH